LSGAAVRRICVFCGSSRGRDPRHAQAAAALGARLARRGIGLVFGGGSVGLMGVLADAVLTAGGAVTGVIPRGLAARELAHRGVVDMRVVPTMHARKALMAELSDAFVALPGGIGTFEELLETATWGQLGIHRKPIGVLNVAGYYEPLVALLEHAVAEGFLSEAGRGLVIADDDAERLLDRLAAHRPLPSPAWVTADET
jgi:uncharacterized protein (TIGR00730 family)